MQDLSRFIEAHEARYKSALAEIENGKKTSHWMWYIFPQLQSLGISETAKYYGIADLEEAEAFLEHQYLGENLIVIAEVLLKHTGKSVTQIFGYPDDLKLRSSMTLFELCTQAPPVFSRLLEQFYDNERCGRTLKLLEK